MVHPKLMVPCRFCILNTMRNRILTALGWLVVASACTPPPPPVAYGDFEELVWIRPPELAFLDSTVSALFSRTYFTPHEDPLFRITVLPSDSFLKNRKGYQQMLWTTLTTAPDFSSFRTLLQAEDPGVHIRRNVFTRNAFLVGVLGSRPEGLEYLLQERGPALRETLLANVLANLRRAVYYAGRNAQAEKRIREQYHLNLEVPVGYAFFLEDSLAFGLAKHNPSRFFAVFRVPAPESLNAATLADLRDSLADLYYEGDRVLRERTALEEGKLGDRAVWILTGPWQNDRENRGGAFRLYVWPEGDTLWLVDTGVYAPERRHKWPLLLRLYVIVSTLSRS